MAAYLSRLGWQLLFHDCEICGVQIDLIMRNPNGLLVLVEVKSQSRGRLAHISWTQMRRLFRAANLLSGYEPIELQLALIEGAKITLLPVDALTAR